MLVPGEQRSHVRWYGGAGSTQVCQAQAGPQVLLSRSVAVTAKESSVSPHGISKTESLADSRPTCSRLCQSDYQDRRKCVDGSQPGAREGGGGGSWGQNRRRGTVAGVPAPGPAHTEGEHGAGEIDPPAARHPPSISAGTGHGASGVARASRGSRASTGERRSPEGSKPVS